MTVLRIDHRSAFSSPPPTATFTCRSAGAGAVVVAVEGEVDASNSDALAEFVATQVCGAVRLVLDCSAVNFFAIEGFSTLQRINVMCAQAGATWVLVPSAPVSRVLTVCKRPLR